MGCYTAYNKENIPDTQSNLVVISNHQRSFDIPIYILCLTFAVSVYKKLGFKKPIQCSNKME
jgi:1-acyl-sn-glycerol-3-phosphate acyltransferase